MIKGTFGAGTADEPINFDGGCRRLRLHVSAISTPRSKFPSKSNERILNPELYSVHHEAQD